MAVAQETGGVPAAVQQFKLPIMDESVRPKSALARGVQIRSYRESNVNPEPIVLEETDILLEEYLSPRRLRALTGVDDLDQVTKLDMKVDTSETSLGNFGSMLPNLSQLKLSNSIISTIRDLGSSLESLRVLWMARCGLQELDGIYSMNNLRELYLSYNEISELGPCSMLEKLQILDLEGNNIEEISQVDFLALCSNLSNLTLDGNPICVTPSPDQAEPSYDYRDSVIKILPQLKILDDEPIYKNKSKTTNSHPPKKKKQQVSVFEDDWALINEIMAEGDLLKDDSESPTPVSRPGTAYRPTTGYKPGSGLRPTTAKRPTTGARPMTGRPMTGRPTTGRPTTARPGTARPGSSDISDVGTDDASELTLGSVVCGNPSKALRLRRKEATQHPVVQTPPKLFAEYRPNPEKPYDRAEAVKEDHNLQEIFDELKEWRVHNDEVKAEREKDGAPQVLRVDEEIIVSSDGDESDTEILYSALGPEPQDNLDHADLDSVGLSDRSGVSDRSSDFDVSKLEQEFMAELDRCSRLMHVEEVDKRTKNSRRHVGGHSTGTAGSGAGFCGSSGRGKERDARYGNGANKMPNSATRKNNQESVSNDKVVKSKRRIRHDESFDASDGEETRSGSSRRSSAEVKGQASPAFRLSPSAQRRLSGSPDERGHREARPLRSQQISVRPPKERPSEPAKGEQARPVIRTPTSPQERNSPQSVGVKGPMIRTPTSPQDRKSSPQSTSVRSRVTRAALALPSQPKISRQHEKQTTPESRR